jgi:hypothetical protein
MSLELGRSSAARDDDSESAEVNDGAAENGAQHPSDDGTSDDAPRRSVLAPFMIAGGADDSPPEEASDNPDDDLDEDSADVASDTGQNGAPEHVDASSPSAPEGSTTADTNADLIDASSQATGEVDGAADEEGPAAATPNDAEAAVTTDDEDAIDSQPGDEQTAAASRADDMTSSGVPRQGDPDDRGTFGADPSLTGAAGPATPAASSVSAPRTGAEEPRLDSGGLGRAGADVDEPLLEDAEALRANWLRLQAGFVDDPHEAVSDAADLVEHTAQALVGALRMRQQELRQMWDGGRSKGSGTAASVDDGQGAQSASADTTEQLRLLMKRYRVLFNHICRS